MKTCFLWFHQWGKWREIDRGVINNRFTPASDWNAVGVYVDQERICERCGAIQVRTSRSRI